MTMIMAEDHPWVKPEYLAHKSAFFQGEEILSSPLEIGISSDWGILPVLAEKIIFHKFKG